MKLKDITDAIDWAEGKAGIKTPRPIALVILFVLVVALPVSVGVFAFKEVESLFPARPPIPSAPPKPSLDGLAQVTCNLKPLPLDGKDALVGIQIHEYMGGGGYLTGFEQIVKQKRNPPSNNLGWQCAITNHGLKPLFHFVVMFKIQYYYTEKDGSSKGRLRMELPRPVSIDTLSPEKPVPFFVWGQHREYTIVQIPDEFIAQQLGSTKPLTGKFLEPNFHGLFVYPQR